MITRTRCVFYLFLDYRALRQHAHYSMHVRGHKNVWAVNTSLDEIIQYSCEQ